MQSSKSIGLLKSFSQENIKDFRAYLLSPFFGSRKALIDLYDYIVDEFPDFHPDLLEKQKIQKSQLDSKFYDEKYLRKMLSFLFKEIESFITHQELSKDPMQMELKLLKYYNEHHLDDLYLDHYKSSEALIASQKQTSSANFLLNTSLCVFLSKNDNRKGDLNYIPTLNSLELLYQFNKLRIYCLILNRSKIVSFDYEKSISKMNVDEDIIKELNHPAINIYQEVFHLLREHSDEAKFKQILKSIEVDFSKIQLEDIDIVFSILSNQCKIIFKNDQKKYYSELFNIYKKQLQYQTIYIESKLRVSILKNIIVLAIHNNEIDWALDFLHQHQHKILPTESQEESYYYLLSEVLFAKKEYDKALTYLSKTKSTDSLIKVAIKRLYLKIFFEKEEFNTFESFATSYKMYLGRDETLTPAKVEAEKHFVNHLMLIFKYKLSKDLPKLEKLKLKIQNENVTDKIYLTDWIQKICSSKKSTSTKLSTR